MRRMAKRIPTGKEYALAGAVIGGGALLAVLASRKQPGYQIPAGTTTPTGPPILNNIVPMPQTCTMHGDRMVCHDCDSRGDASFASMALC